MAVEKWFDDDAGPMVRPYTVTGGRTRPARPDLNMITMVTALSSAEHPAMAPEHQAILADRIPNAQLEIVERAGHNPQDERPAEVIEVIRRVLTTTYDTAGSSHWRREVRTA